MKMQISWALYISFAMVLGFSIPSAFGQEATKVNTTHYKNQAETIQVEPKIRPSLTEQQLKNNQKTGLRQGLAFCEAEK